MRRAGVRTFTVESPRVLNDIERNIIRVRHARSVALDGIEGTVVVDVDNHVRVTSIEVLDRPDVANELATAHIGRRANVEMQLASSRTRGVRRTPERKQDVTIKARLRDVLTAFKSIGSARTASSHIRRCEKLREAGQKAEALAVARAGLEVLHAPHVRRHEPPEATGLLMLTINVEHLAAELGESGAPVDDLASAVRFLQLIPEHGSGTAAALRKEWLPFLEARLATVTRSHPSGFRSEPRL